MHRRILTALLTVAVLAAGCTTIHIRKDAQGWEATVDLPILEDREIGRLEVTIPGEKDGE